MVERGTHSPSSSSSGAAPERVLGGPEDQHRLLMESLTDYALFFLDLHGRIAASSAGAAHIFGYPEEDLRGRHYSCLYTPADIQEQVPERELHTAALTGRMSDDRWLLRRDGQRLWCSGVTAALRDEANQLRGFAKVVRDNSAQKRLEEALQQRAAELANEARKKDEFLAVLGHELRNPLAPIRNALQVIRLRGQANPLVDQMRAIAERQLEYLTHLVDDLLDLSRISRGLIQLHRRVINVAQPVQQAVEAVQHAVEERQLTLTLHLPTEPVFVDADPTRLQQIVGNLLTNAIKYTDPGGTITLTVGEEGTEVVVRVRDTGIGIAPVMLLQVFDLFVQAERRLDRSQGGLGIGLTLVRRLVELHGGSITASSEGLGKGSEFMVRIPVVSEEESAALRKQAQTPDPAREAMIRPRHILVVDDNTDAAESLAVLLRFEGHEVRVVGSGAEALTAVQAAPPEVVVLDLGMPEMDGFEVARQLRALPGTEHLLILALTGWAQEEDRRRCQEAGFDGHLSKPVELQALRQFLLHPKLPS